MEEPEAIHEQRTASFWIPQCNYTKQHRVDLTVFSLLLQVPDINLHNRNGNLAYNPTRNRGTFGICWLYKEILSESSLQRTSNPPKYFIYFCLHLLPHFLTSLANSSMYLTLFCTQYCSSSLYFHQNDYYFLIDMDSYL